MDNNLGYDNEDDDHLINHHHLTALPECTTRTTAALIKESNDPIIQLEYVRNSNLSFPRELSIGNDFINCALPTD